LAADLDRVQNAPGGAEILQSDPRLKKLHQALLLLTDSPSNRAEQVQMLFSDQTK
jgi:rRNA pseudouridine-1189 N-methylase Emg1 (Nep1/Mra1 family)